MTLANRLCSFFLAAVAVLLVGFSATLYLLIALDLYHDVDERLAGVLEQMGAEVIDHPHRVEWKVGAWQPALDIGHEDGAVAWAVYTSDGRPLERSADFLPDEDARIVALMPDSGHRHVTLIRPDGGRWRLTVRRKRAATAVAGEPPVADPDELDEEQPSMGAGPPLAEPFLLLATAAPLEPVQATLARMALLLAGSSLAIWLLAAVAGNLACRRSLRPMTRMSEAARTMSATDRGRRLPSPGTRDELESLAGAFNGLLDRLGDALERQDRFAGDASHQLRTPLTALIGEVEVALRRDRSASDYRQVLDDVHAEALRLRQIVESLLFLARAEEGRPDLETVDLEPWILDHLPGAAIGERAADLRVEVASVGPFPARVSPALLGELLDNLLDNAAKYSTPGSPIVVRLVREPGVVCFAVEDHGCGLGPEDLALVFDPFYRSERSRRLGYPGVGLGLSVVQRIVSAFGGTVRADGEPGRGARFAVRLPDASGKSPACA